MCRDVDDLAAVLCLSSVPSEIVLAHIEVGTCFGSSLVGAYLAVPCMDMCSACSTECSWGCGMQVLAAEVGQSRAGDVVKAVIAHSPSLAAVLHSRPAQVPAHGPGQCC